MGLINEQNTCHRSVRFRLRYERSDFRLNFNDLLLQVKLGVEVRSKSI